MIDAIQVRDYDCNHYLIPTELSDDFQIMLTAIDQCMWGTDEWFEANIDLHDAFGKYLVC
jgi:hypothetical protein